MPKRMKRAHKKRRTRILAQHQVEVLSDGE